ncbi:MAG: tripartite tricarboxylate transporter substrate binding protein [Bradyrhizobium sp.]|nr:tripartite tricarboxylate transporter substrate binding protein [Bradyrhizobium sp.]
MVLRQIAVAAYLCAMTLPCAAQEFPTRPITIVAPSAAGGLSDIIARLVANKAAIELGGTIIVENKPGASGAIGGSSVMRAAPDGYTILLANGTSHGALPALNTKLAYDPIKDFVPIMRVGETQLALVASKKLPVKNAPELLAYARSNPGKINYGTFGHGSAGHLFGEVLKKRNGIDIVHVPYKGEAAVMQALIAEEIELAIVVSARPYVEQGQVTLIGLTGPESSDAYPGWPTLSSQNVDGFSLARGFQAFLVRAGTPQAVVDRLAGAFSKAIADPEVRRQLLELGVNPAAERAADFPALYRSLVEQWALLVGESGVTTE